MANPNIAALNSPPTRSFSFTAACSWFTTAIGVKPSEVITPAIPISPARSSSSASTGITSSAASTRGSTSQAIGSMPMMRSASTSSFTVMVPSSAAKAEPVRPERMTAAISGPSSRSSEMPTRFGMKISAPNWRIGIEDWKARISPISTPSSAVRPKARSPASSRWRSSSGRRSRQGRRRMPRPATSTSPRKATPPSMLRPAATVASPMRPRKGRDGGGCGGGWASACRVRSSTAWSLASVRPCQLASVA
jgi:hypothetical protein